MVDMGNKRYYNDLYTIESDHRRMKYEKLLISSMINDMHKWTQKIKSDGIPLYNSPNYSGSIFYIEARSYFTFAFITHSTPIIPGQQSELIVDEGLEMLLLNCVIIFILLIFMILRNRLEISILVRRNLMLLNWVEFLRLLRSLIVTG